MFDIHLIARNGVCVRAGVFTQGAVSLLSRPPLARVYDYVCGSLHFVWKNVWLKGARSKAGCGVS